jgi:hypothetical protein
MRNLRYLAACALLSGCTAVSSLGGGHVKAYEGPERKDAEVATLFTPKPAGKPMAFLAKVDDLVYGDDYLRGYPMITKILPGSHRIYLKCNLNTHYAFTTITREFQAGRHYELICENTGTGKAAFGIADRGTTPPPPR